MDNIFIARQPIYDRLLHVFGYELLFRAADTDHAEIEDGDQASSQVIINTFMDVGIENIVGSSTAFINVPQGFVVNHALLPMFHDQTALELLEDIRPTPEVIAGVRRLKDKGYRIALDDFEYRDELEPILALADYVKIDVRDGDRRRIAAEFENAKRHNARTVAEKVETLELFALCRTMGFDYFQGFFFCRPQLTTQKNLHPSKLVVLNLLRDLQDPDLNLNDLKTLLAQDAVLSFKLMRYINSAAFPFRKEIESVTEAVLLIGTETMKNWASLILMTSVIEDKPRELLVTGMIRAKLCESLAEVRQPAISAQMFLVGLFSVLDALMDRPMVDLLDEISVSVPVKLALLEHEGEHGEILRQVLLHEQGRWAELTAAGVDAKDLVPAYTQAIQWAGASIGILA